MSIRPYALTYPQLMNQALAQGSPEPDLARLSSACGHAEGFLDGMYRGQGVPFLCHSVRTASIVLTECQPTDVVIASLLHAVYMMGMFSDREVGNPTPHHREEVRRAAGEAVEQWIIDYDRLPWREAGAVAAHVRQLPSYPERTRRLLTMRLANELEDYLDGALAFRGGDPLRERAAAGRREAAGLATALGLDRLAGELREAMEAAGQAHPPGWARRQPCFAYEHPAHKRLRVGWRQRLRSRLQRAKRSLTQRHAAH